MDTLFSSCSGTLQVGTSELPIQSNVKARVIFVDDDPVTDSQLLSRGAILLGKTTIYGTEKTEKAIISPHAVAGDSKLTLTSAPNGWNVDDELIITGTLVNNPRSDEIGTINQVNGNEISLNAPLDLDHSAPKADLNVYVANATRNVEFSSENPAISRRGHIMFMHTQNVEVHNARFTELGRTDKTTPLNDFEFVFGDDSDGDDAPATAEVVALGGSNIRGRYAIHFHQAGIDPNSTPAIVKGSVVFNGPGWGFVNHSSHVDFVDNVSYGLQGAGFYTEAGDEIGTMQGNIAIRSVNDAFQLGDQGAIDPDLRANRMDYVHNGDGFWLSGNGVEMIDNVAAGATAHGIIYWTDGIMEPAQGMARRVTVPVKYLPNGNLITDRDSVPVWWAPLAENRNNESYGSTVGFRIRYIHAKNYLGREEQSDFHRTPSQAYVDTLAPQVNGLTIWGNRDGVMLNYNEKLSLNGARIVGFGKDISKFEFNEGTAKEGVGLDLSNSSTFGPASVKNVTIEGYGVAFALPVNGIWSVQNTSLFENNVDMLILEPDTNPTQISLQQVSYSSLADDDGTLDELPEHVTAN